MALGWTDQQVAEVGTFGMGEPAVGSWSVTTGVTGTPSIGQLSGLSCPTTTWCAAVGAGGAADGGQVPVVDIWSDGSWTATALPRPADAQATPYGPSAAHLSGVSCPSPGVCTAVGAASRAKHSQRQLVETLTDGTWTVAHTPKVRNSQLRSVSCPQQADCVAVGIDPSQRPSGGYRPGGLLIDRLRAGTWRVDDVKESGMASADGAAFTSVSCPTLRTCWAVGIEVQLAGDGAGTKYTVTATRSGHGWAFGDSATEMDANAVSCALGAGCMYVGWSSHTEEGSPTPAVEGDLDVTPAAVNQPDGEGSGILNGVSCPSPTDCVAVGDAAPATGPNTYGSSVPMIAVWSPTGS
jgi:hypothetical protein